jgi:hypothetical protein
MGGSANRFPPWKFHDRVALIWWRLELKGAILPHLAVVFRFHL